MGEVGWGECRDGYASAHRPRWAAQAPAHHVPRTSGRERMEMCANGHRFWPALATAAASSACWQHACQQGAQRVGRRPVWPGEGWQHGSGRPRERVIPPLRAATPTPWHARDHQPWLRWLPLRAASQGLLLLLLSTWGQAARATRGYTAAGSPPYRPRTPSRGCLWYLWPASAAPRPPPHPRAADRSTIEPYERWSKHRGFVAVFGRVFG